MSNDENCVGVGSGEDDYFDMETEGTDITEETYEADGPFEYNGKSFRELTIKDFDGTYFKSVEDAEKFYEIYSSALGFRIRKYRREKDLSGIIKRRNWVCTKEGQRKDRKDEDRSRPPKSSNREKCKAAFGVKYSKELDAYYVKSFITQHSHELSKSNMVQSLLSHCVGKKVDLAHAVIMPKAKDMTRTSAAHENHSSRRNECGGSTTELDMARSVALCTARESIETPAAYVYHLSGGNELVDLTIVSNLEQGVAMRKGSVNSAAASQNMVEPAGGHAFVGLPNRTDWVQTAAMHNLYHI